MQTALIFKHSFFRFLITGGSGVFLNIVVTTGLTEFVFGREHYFWAYIAGTSVNLMYNFILHSRFTFITQNRHAKHLAIFVGFNILSTLLQMLVVSELVQMIGTTYYILIIASTILIFSIGSYVFFKRVLFASRA